MPDHPLSPFGPPVDPTTTPVRLYGGPTLVQNEEEVPLTPQQAAFLTIVMAHGGAGVSRSRLSWLMWEEDAEEGARGRISQLLYGLKKRASVAPVVADGDDLKPAPEITSDLGCLRLRRTLRPVTGKPLEKLTPPYATGALEKWLTSQRTTLRFLAIERNGELLASAEENHDYEIVVEAARALHEYDPVNERALRSMVRAVALSSSALQAEAAYRHQVEIVKRILPDWSPSVETRRLLREIDSLRRRQIVSAKRRGMQHTVRLVGRRKELTRLRECALGPGDGYRDIMIVGEPGVGKSRLLEELGRQLALDDCRLVRVRSYAAEEGIAFNLLSDIARSEPFQEAIRNIAPLWRQAASMSLTIEPVDVPEEDLPEVPADSAARRAYEAMRHLFEAVEGRVVILADGFGAADSSSLAALAFLRRRVKKSTIRFIGTVARDALRRTDGQAQYLRDLMEDVDARVELEALSDEESAELLAAARDDQLDTRTAQHLVQLAGGNPLFLIELAQGEGEFPGGAPAPLHEILQRRFTNTTPSTRTFLNVLSTQMAPRSLSHIAEICEFSRGEALTSLDEALQRRLVFSDENGLKFRHGLMQQWVYDLLTGAQRQFIHRATAQELLRAESPPASDLAFHYHAAGEPEAAFRWSTEGAETSELHAAFPDMIRLLAIAASSAPTNETRFAVLTQLGRILIRQREMRRAVEVLQSAEDVADESTPWTHRATARLSRCRAAVEVGLVSPMDAVQELEALKVEAKERSDTAVLLATIDAQLVIANSSMFLERARGLLREAEEISLPERDYLNRCQLNLIRTFNLLYGTRPLAVSAVQEALRLAEFDGADHLWLRCIARLFIVHCWTGDLKRSQTSVLLPRAEERASVSGDQNYLLRIYVNLSTWLIDIHELDEAEAVMRKADEFAQTQDAEKLRVSIEANWGELYLNRREFEFARSHFESILRIAPTHRADVRLSATAGWGLCNLEMGQLSKAKEIIQQIPFNDYLGKTTNFDPSLIMILHAKWLDRLGKSQAAVDLLDKARTFLQERYVPSGYKLALIQTRLMKRRKIEGYSDLAGEYEQKARAVGLDRLASIFDRAGNPRFDSGF